MLHCLTVLLHSFSISQAPARTNGVYFVVLAVREDFRTEASMFIVFVLYSPCTNCSFNINWIYIDINYVHLRFELAHLKYIWSHTFFFNPLQHRCLAPGISSVDVSWRADLCAWNENKRNSLPSTRRNCRKEIPSAGIAPLLSSHYLLHFSLASYSLFHSSFPTETLFNEGARIDHRQWLCRSQFACCFLLLPVKFFMQIFIKPRWKLQLG